VTAVVAAREALSLVGADTMVTDYKLPVWLPENVNKQPRRPVPGLLISGFSPQQVPVWPTPRSRVRSSSPSIHGS
jgi:hypothetical protein